MVVGVLVASVLALPAAPAMAKTYRLSGRLIPTDPNKPILKMTGGLLGTFRGLTSTDTAKSPLVQNKGTERFTGCIDRARDKSCAGDPKGTLKFSFRFWGMPGAQKDTEVWGACYHQIVGGTGAFAGAKGVIMMVDTPIGGDQTKLRTDYIGNVTLPDAGAGARSAVTAAAGGDGCRA
jgi:hypothetical protein